jgi:cytoskeletal protein RodZ
VNNSTSLQKVPNASKMTSTASKVPTNKSGTLKKSSKKSYLSATTPLSRNPAPPKKSSFRNILLLFVLIFCGIGLILFFIFRYRKNRENDDISLLNRNDSDESYNSVTIESEINPSQDEQSHIDRTRKGGRMFSQLDPDAL